MTDWYWIGEDWHGPFATKAEALADAGTAILTIDGRPVVDPVRADFPPGIEGTIAFQRAVYAVNDAISRASCAGIEEGLRRGMRGKRVK